MLIHGGIMEYYNYFSVTFWIVLILWSLGANFFNALNTDSDRFNLKWDAFFILLGFCIVGLSIDSEVHKILKLIFLSIFAIGSHIIRIAGANNYAPLNNDDGQRALADIAGGVVLGSLLVGVLTS